MISNNDDSDIAEDEDEVQKFSDLLLINSKEEEMTCEKTLKTDEKQERKLMMLKQKILTKILIKVITQMLNQQ